jgi:hypothetical protein
MSTSAPRKGPGRPRKQPTREPLAKCGVVTTPREDLPFPTMVDIAFNQPLLFRKLTGLFKSMSARELRFTFEPNALTIRTRDHAQKNIAKAVFRGSEMTWYYVREPYVATISVDALVTFMPKVDKTYGLVRMVVNNDLANTSMRFILTLVDTNTFEAHDVNLITATEEPIEDGMFDTTNYQIFATFPSVYFRKVISDIHKVSDIIRFVKRPGKPLVAEYTTRASRVDSTIVMPDSADIQMRTNLEPMEVFSIATNSGFLSPTAMNTIADHVTFSASMTGDIIITQTTEGSGITLSIRTAVNRG